MGSITRTRSNNLWLRRQKALSGAGSVNRIDISNRRNRRATYSCVRVDHSRHPDTVDCYVPFRLQAAFFKLVRSPGAYASHGPGLPIFVHLAGKRLPSDAFGHRMYVRLSTELISLDR